MSGAATDASVPGSSSSARGAALAPNLDKAEELIRRAAKGGAIYVQTPENTGLMELKPELVLEAAETEERSAPLARLTALARELGIFLHIGSLAVKLDETRVANRSYLIDPEGRVQNLRGVDLLNRRPLDRDFAGEFGLDHQPLTVGLLDGSCQTIAVLQYNLVGDQRCRTQKDEMSATPFFRHLFPPKNGSQKS